MNGRVDTWIFVAFCLPLAMRTTSNKFTFYIYLELVGAKLQATNRVPRPVDRGTATRYGG